MKIPHKQQSKTKKVLIACGVIILMLLLGVTLAYYRGWWPFQPQTTQANPSNTVNYDKPTPEQTEAGKTIKEKVADQAKDDSNTAPKTSTVALDITAANKSSDTLLIRTLIQTITSSGTCSLTMSGPGGASYTATAGVQANASTSTCQGFNVPLSSLSEGKWKITIDFKDGDLAATASKEVTI